VDLVAVSRTLTGKEFQVASCKMLQVLRSQVQVQVPDPQVQVQVQVLRSQVQV